MKKIVGIIAAAALATSAFAEINIGSWNKLCFVPVATDADGNVNAFSGTAWGAASGGNYGGTVRTSFSANTENAGLVLDYYATNGSAGLGDNAYVYVKPVEMLRVAFGQVDNNSGRADVCFGNYDHSFRYTNLFNGEGLGGTGRSHGKGLDVTLTPVEGLTIDYAAGFTDDYANGGSARAYSVLLHSADLMVQYAGDFGSVRGIVQGHKPGYDKEGKEKEWFTICAAADITAIENLKLTFGVSVPTLLDGYTSNPEASKDAVDEAVADYMSGTTTEAEFEKAMNEAFSLLSANSVGFGVGAHYNLDALAIHGFVDAKINPDKIDTDGAVKLGAFGLTIGAGLDYAFNDTFSLITDFRFRTDKYAQTGYELDGTDVKATYGKSAWGAYVGGCQKLTNASFDFGVMLVNEKGIPSAVDTGVTFAVPLTITASF